MPSAQQHLDDNNALRIMAYGPAKSKKTWWACRAAEFGYRVLLFDFEDGSGILNQLPQEARDRIFILPFADAGKDSFAIEAATVILKEYHFYVNEETRTVTGTAKVGSYHIDMRNFGRDTVVIFDSYTALVHSAARRFARDHNLDLADAEKTDWPGYGWAGRLLNWMLGQMEHFPCPFILIGHETQNVIRKKVLGNAKAQKNAPIERVRRQIYSSSNPHGLGIGKNFTDIIYLAAIGRTFKVDTRGSRDEDGGCRNIPPGLYDWDALTFQIFADAVGLSQPKNVQPWHFDVMVDQLATPVKPTLDGGQTSGVNFPILIQKKNKGLIL